MDKNNNKGYSYDAYNANEKAKEEAKKGNTTSIALKFNPTADRIVNDRMNEIGFEDCSSPG